MPTCFVMQPFDGAKYDKRYEDVFEAAIRDAGLEPYRVDRDPAASIPIEDIQDGIKSADVCFAEITTDNPNVWFELGFATALGNDVVLVCSEERRSPFPFDVQHRKIITYCTESPSDFERLKGDITARIRAIREKGTTMRDLASRQVLEPMQGLSDHEIVALAMIAAGGDVPGDSVSAWSVKRDCERAGYTELAVALALRSLGRRGYVASSDEVDQNGNEYGALSATDQGFDWLEANKDHLSLRRKSGQDLADADVDIPF